MHAYGASKVNFTLPFSLAMLSDNWFMLKAVSWSYNALGKSGEHSINWCFFHSLQHPMCIILEHESIVNITVIMLSSNMWVVWWLIMLDSRWSSPGSSPGQHHYSVCCVLEQSNLLSDCLSPPRYINAISRLKSHPGESRNTEYFCSSCFIPLWYLRHFHLIF